MKIILGETLTDNEKLTVISFDETYVTKRICYDKKNEQMIGPHKCVQVLIVRGIYILYPTSNNIICSTRITFLNRSNITMETTVIL